MHVDPYIITAAAACPNSAQTKVANLNPLKFGKSEANDKGSSLIQQSK